MDGRTIRWYFAFVAVVILAGIVAETWNDYMETQVEIARLQAGCPAIPE